MSAIDTGGQWIENFARRPVGGVAAVFENVAIENQKMDTISRVRVSRLGFGLLVSVVALSPQASWGGEAAPQRFHGYYQELQEAARRGPFGFPLQVRSEERGNLVTAEALGIMDHSLQAFREAVIEPAAWCDFIPLNLNIKACTFHWDGNEPLLTFYIGGKGYLAPESASQQPYRFAVRARHAEYVSVSLSALQGLMGTKAHQLEFEAASVAGKTVVVLRSSYEQSAVSKLVTAIYLATVGRDKVGFSREPLGPDGQASFVKGAQGIIERNLMRYYLILKAYLDTRTLPHSRRFEALISEVYDLMERYPAQLHEVERSDYLDVKRRERQNQDRMQKALGPARPQPAGP